MMVSGSGWGKQRQTLQGQVGYEEGGRRAEGRITASFGTQDSFVMGHFHLLKTCCTQTPTEQRNRPGAT